MIAPNPRKGFAKNPTNGNFDTMVNAPTPVTIAPGALSEGSLEANAHSPATPAIAPATKPATGDRLPNINNPMPPAMHPIAATPLFEKLLADSYGVISLLTMILLYNDNVYISDISNSILFFGENGK
jgi:hypothetical protein